MSAAGIISLGCIEGIENGSGLKNPVLQLVRITPSSTNGQSGSRCKIGLSDGVTLIQGIIPEHVIKTVCNGKQLERGMIIKLTNYRLNDAVPQAGHTSVSKFYLIILGFEMVKDVPLELCGHLGDDSDRSRAGTSRLPSQPQQPQQIRPPAPTYGHNNSYDKSTPQRNNNLDEGICTIDHISPYHNKWKLKAMVVQKSELKTWTNARGSGKLFNVTLMDNTGEIRATAFNQQAEEYANSLQLNKVYYISKGKVNIAKKQFSNVQNDYEITIEASTVIEQADDSVAPIKIKIDPIKISDLMDYEKDQTVDVVAAIKEISETSQITTKNQKMLDKRDVKIVDESNYEVRLTTWGQQVHELRHVEIGTVVVCKNARVNDYQGRCLSMYGTSKLLIDPNIPETNSIREWVKNGGLNSETNVFAGSYSSGSTMNAPEKTIAQVINENIGQNSEKGEYFVTRGTIVFIKKEKNMYYAACPSAECNKKVVEDGENSYRCEKCSRSYDHAEYRYIFGVNVSDHTDSIWLQCFNETGTKIMEKDANELSYMKDNEESAFESWIDSRLFRSYIFKCRAKMEIYQERTMVKYQVTEVTPIDFVKDGNALLDNIKELEKL